MSAVWIVVSIALFLGVLVMVVWALYELVLARHGDPFRDPLTGGRRWASPQLESRAEYEQTHETGTPHLESRAEYEQAHPVTTAR